MCYQHIENQQQYQISHELNILFTHGDWLGMGNKITKLTVYWYEILELNLLLKAANSRWWKNCFKPEHKSMNYLIRTVRIKEQNKRMRIGKKKWKETRNRVQYHINGNACVNFFSTHCLFFLLFCPLCESSFMLLRISIYRELK